MTFEHFSHISIRVSDMDRARRFYRETLGFEEVSELRVDNPPSFAEKGIADGSMHAVFLRRDGVVIELQDVRYRSGEMVPGHLHPFGLKHLSLRVTGMDEAAGRVQETGGDVLPWSRFRNDEHRSEVLFVTDPDGTRVELIDVPGDPAAPLGTPLG